MDTPEQAQLRRHLTELRHATHGIGKDFAIEFEALGRKIDRLGSVTGKEAKYFVLDVQDDLSNLGHAIHREAKRLPGEIAGGISRAGVAVGSGVSRFAGATKDTLESAGKKAAEGTKNTFASLAGMRRTPMREWKPPTEE